MKNHYFRPDVPKINPLIDLSNDSVYSTGFPQNSYLWSINKDYIKKKNGKLVSVLECRLLESPDINQIFELLSSNIMINPRFTGGQPNPITGKIILIENITITEATKEFPAFATLAYSKIDDDLTVNKKHGIFHLHEITVIDGQLYHVWEDWNSRFPLSLNFPRPELLHKIKKNLDFQDLQANKFQYSIF